MNPQPPEYVGSLCALGFFIVVLYYYFVSYHDGNSKMPSDNFIIGYLDESTNTPIVHSTPVIHNTPVVNVKIVKPKSYEGTQMFTDCVDALCALGMRKGAAKNKVKEVYEQLGGPPENLQQFLMIAMRKQ